jgi:siroheme synthase-like protein
MSGEPAARRGLGGYPANLLVAGRRCVVVGAGRIAARKIEALLDAGADVHVVAPELGAEVQGWSEAGRLTVAPRPFEPGDLDDAWLVTAAVDDPAVSRAVFEAAEARRVWCNAADDPASCSFTLMSVVRQGDLVVTIGTGGRSPALAAYLKDHVAQEMGPEWAELLELLSEVRERIRATGASSEGVDWRRALDSGMLELIRAGRTAEAKELLEACLSSSSD